MRLITFASPEFAASAETLRWSAISRGGFDSAEVFGPADVRAHLERVFSGRVPPDLGHGLWAWKPHLVSEALRRAPDGEWVVWCDAAAEFVGSMARALTSCPGDVWLSAVPNGETVGDLTSFALEEAEAAAPMVNAALVAFRASAASRRFAAAWVDGCTAEALGAGPRRRHRHDQSVLSVVRFRAGVCLSRGVTQHDDAVGFVVDHHRLRKSARPRVAVVTPTIGSAHLRRCVESVQSQTVPGVTHVLFADGPEAWAAVEPVAREFSGRQPIVRANLPFPTGRGGWNGHRVYAAAPFLLGDAFDFVCYLDEDNAFAAGHVASLLSVLSDGAVWAHSLRRAFGPSLTGPAPIDECESLGAIPNVLGDFLVDTSCFMLPVSVAREVSGCWNVVARPGDGLEEADRAVTRALLRRHAARCTDQATVYYRCGSRPDSVTQAFFTEGNGILGRRAGLENLFVFHLTPEATAAALHVARAPEDPSLATCLREWNPSFLRDLHGRVNLVDGYLASAAAPLPAGALVLVSLCHPSSAPLDLLRARPDLRRMVWTAESPNYRHRAQWTRAFLEAHFDVVITYWAPLLRDAGGLRGVVHLPHNTHHLPSGLVAEVAAAAARRSAISTPPTCAMVLERRQTMPVSYRIDGETLKNLEFLRPRLVNAAAARGSAVTVCGVGWNSAILAPGVRVASTLHRSADSMSGVERLRPFDVALISENCDAEGYVSEKMYDALIAGCVPAWAGCSAGVPTFLDGLYVDILRSWDLGAVRARCTEARVADVLGRVGCAAAAEAVLRGAAMFT